MKEEGKLSHEEYQNVIDYIKNNQIKPVEFGKGLFIDTGFIDNLLYTFLPNFKIS